MAALLDVDTGYDDALAVLLALRLSNLSLLGITCVAGNHRLHQVVQNTSKLLDIAGSDVGLAAGADRPLIERMRPPDPLHGKDGMADLELPPSQRTLYESHAVHYMARAIQRAETPVDLICLAPLTNIALFLRTYPHLTERINTLWIMGGTMAAPGNVTAAAEFNIRHDPEAAAIVLQSGLKIRLYPLDVFRQVAFTRGEIADFLRSADPCAITAGRIMDFSARYFHAESALIGDAGTVAVAVEPTLARFERFPIQVVLEGEARGMTLVDRRSPSTRARENHWWETTPHEVEIAVEVDVTGIRELFRRSLGISS